MMTTHTHIETETDQTGVRLQKSASSTYTSGELGPANGAVELRAHPNGEGRRPAKYWREQTNCGGKGFFWFV